MREPNPGARRSPVGAAPADGLRELGRRGVVVLGFAALCTAAFGACEPPPPPIADPAAATAAAADACVSGEPDAVDAAVETMDRVLRDPAAPVEAWAVRGLCLWTRHRAAGADGRASDIEQAYLDYSRAIEAAGPDDAIPLADLYAERAAIVRAARPGEPQAEWVDLGEALRLRPAAAGLRARRAEAALRVGDTLRAVEDLRTLAQTPGPAADSARARLRELGR